MVSENGVSLGTLGIFMDTAQTAWSSFRAYPDIQISPHQPVVKFVNRVNRSFGTMWMFIQATVRFSLAQSVFKTIICWLKHVKTTFKNLSVAQNTSNHNFCSLIICICVSQLMLEFSLEFSLQTVQITPKSGVFLASGHQTWRLEIPDYTCFSH